MAEHSVYSFSGSHIWIEDHCPASIRMCRGYPNTTNPAAERGTIAHTLGETCIALGIKPIEFIGLNIDSHEIDEKMADDVSLYVNVINDFTARYNLKPLLEQRVVMSSLNRDDVYGTSDCTHIALVQRVLHTSDYKNGYENVEVINNSQTAGYSVATMDTYDLWDKVDVIYNTIVQPNGNHIQGPVRTVQYTVPELLQWRDKYKRSVILADDPNTKPKAGPWCKYCKAQANCRTRMEYSLAIAYTNEHIEGISVQEIECLYKELDNVKKFFESVESRALAEARKGYKFQDYKLVNSYPRAQVKDEKCFITEALKHGVKEIDLYNNPKLIGKTKAKKLLPVELVNKYYKTPKPSTTLVKMNDNRPAVRINDAKDLFSNKSLENPSAVGVFKPR